MYDLVRGPLVWVSIIVFVLGTVFQVIRFYRLSKKLGTPSVRVRIRPVKKRPAPIQSFDGAFADWLSRVKLTILGKSPITIIVSSIFHFCLFITPIFLLGHNELFDLSWGFSLFSFSEAFTDFLTQVLLVCAAYFLFRRLFIPRVRSISSPYDFVVLFIAVMPFLTGYLAYHHIFHYRTVMILHMLFGELMLIAIPFTKLTHMIFFFLNRFIILNEHTLGKGSRVYT